MHFYVWIVLIVGVVGLGILGGWYLRRRAWPASKQDEAMRRHVIRNYD
jgi:uncharacterized protein YneF (UPF0154 family)